MKKLILFFCCFSLCASTHSAEFSFRPLATIAVGGDIENTPSNTKNIVLLQPFYNAYTSGGHDTQAIAGLFLGGEVHLPKNFLGQLGLNYYQNKPYVLKGSVYQFGSPSFNNLSYQYFVRSRRILLDSKLLSTIQRYFHPFVTLGAGEAINQAFQYIEIPVDTTDVSTAQPFNNRTYHSFTYELGLGLDVDIGEHMRGGIAYRFVDLGGAGLGTSPSQVSSQTINASHLRANEFLVQISYMG